MIVITCRWSQPPFSILVLLVLLAPLASLHLQPITHHTSLIFTNRLFKPRTSRRTERRVFGLSKAKMTFRLWRPSHPWLDSSNRNVAKWFFFSFSTGNIMTWSFWIGLPSKAVDTQCISSVPWVCMEYSADAVMHRWCKEGDFFIGSCDLGSSWFRSFRPWERIYVVVMFGWDYSWTSLIPWLGIS